MNSCHKVVRSMRNTTLKLWAIARSNSSETHRIVEKPIMDLHHNDAPAHTSMLYSPDLVPSDFFLFPKLKKGKRFTAIEEIKEKSKQELLAIPKGAFQKCFEDWKKTLA